MSLGYFVPVEEAALCIARVQLARPPENLKRAARTPEKLAEMRAAAAASAARAASAPPPITAEEAAEAEGLTLVKADNFSGFKGVYFHNGRAKPYQVQVGRGGKTVHLGRFATAEAAALCYARTLEGRRFDGGDASVVRRAWQTRLSWHTRVAMAAARATTARATRA